MKQRAITLILTGGCIAMAVIGIVIFLGDDRMAPVIEMEMRDIVYVEGEDEAILLEDVTATDRVDGDLTDSVFIDKILPAGDGYAVVYYGVMDKEYNVGTARRRIEYYASQEEAQQAGADAEEGGEAAGENPEQGETAAEGTSAEETPAELTPEGASPVMALTAAELTIAAGEEFDPLTMVRDVADDKDDKDTLYQHLHADGQYDVNTPGTYEIRYYVTDSDGNYSEPQVFTLTVQ